MELASSRRGAPHLEHVCAASGVPVASWPHRASLWLRHGPASMAASVLMTQSRACHEARRRMHTTCATAPAVCDGVVRRIVTVWTVGRTGSGGGPPSVCSRHGCPLVGCRFALRGVPGSWRGHVRSARGRPRVDAYQLFWGWGCGSSRTSNGSVSLGYLSPVASRASVKRTETRRPARVATMRADHPRPPFSLHG